MARQRADAPASPERGRRIAAILGLLALAGALATLERWTADDAFISFRYASNLLDGLGLVFNVGERVEAYTNFLWTLWTAVGLALGRTAEGWCHASGATLHLATILLLLWNHRRTVAVLGEGPGWLPLAALGYALHRDASLFATSGLETPAFTFLLLAAVLLVAWHGDSKRALGAAGLLLGLAALTRPEGPLVAATVGAVAIVRAPREWRGLAGMFVAFAALWLSHLLWRHAYYGEWVPNTYYAKSAWLPWYEQGWRYTVLYFEKYWALLAGPLLLGVVGLTGARRGRDRRVVSLGLLAAAIAAVWTFYVVRVGGDFMFARFMLPVTPLLLVLLELGWLAAFARFPRRGVAAAAVLLAGIAFTPAPVSGTVARSGVIDEHAYYSDERVGELEAKSAVLARYFDGLPARVAFYGNEARVVYRVGFPFAFESHAALTEPQVARAPLESRGRPGHEKQPSLRYLVEERHADITFSAVPQRTLRLAEQIPEIIVEFDGGVTGQLLRWNPELVDALRRRGARVPPFERMVEDYVARIESIPEGQVAADYARLRLFYFSHVPDAVREAAFRRRLAAP